MSGELRNVAENHLVGIALNEVFSSARLRRYVSNDLGVSIFELSEASELLSLLLIGVSVSHKGII